MCHQTHNPLLHLYQFPHQFVVLLFMFQGLCVMSLLNFLLVMSLHLRVLAMCMHYSYTLSLMLHMSIPHLQFLVIIVHNLHSLVHLFCQPCLYCIIIYSTYGACTIYITCALCFSFGQHTSLFFHEGIETCFQIPLWDFFP